VILFVNGAWVPLSTNVSSFSVGKGADEPEDLAEISSENGLPVDRIRWQGVRGA
jgi:hypothetical protein